MLFPRLLFPRLRKKDRDGVSRGTGHGAKPRKMFVFLVCHWRKFTTFTTYNKSRTDVSYNRVSHIFLGKFFVMVAALRKKQSSSRRKLQELDFSSLIKYRES